jgi:hypothetical protein
VSASTGEKDKQYTQERNTMTERFYIFDEITENINCLEYAKSVLGLKPSGTSQDHFNCPWRAGANSGSFQINDKTWTDHTKPQNDGDRSGNVITLCANVRHAGDLQAAQEELGDTLGIEPHIFTKTESIGRGKHLESTGFEAVTTYDYVDPETLEVAHQVTRYEHPTAGKEFVQHTPTRGNIKGVKTFLYQAPKWMSKKYVILCEGEKDADNLLALGLPATTNPSGAGHWQERWSNLMRGKSVVIMEDHDAAGRQRSAYIAHELKSYIIALKIIRLPDLAQGGDVSDWIEAHPGSPEMIKKDLLSIIGDTESLDPDEVPNPNDNYEEVCKAKELNKYEYKNYIAIKSEDPNEPNKQTPIHINKLTKEIHERFLGFPRRQGNMMFDHDRKTGDIVFIDKQAKLFAWIQRKSCKLVRWGRKEGCVSREEMFEALRDEAQQYNGISQVPDWPIREDIYYAHDPLPAPTEDHKAFWSLVDHFEAETMEDYALIAAYIMSPIFYRYGMSRPMWIIDSDKTGSGKTTLATTTALLYGASPIEVKQRDLMRDTQEITKRMISSTGRQARICLLDNVTGTFGGEEISAMVTMPEITGRPVHGRDEESRPNNLTYTVTANNATVSDDIAIRSWMIMLTRPPEYRADWGEKLIQYVNTHRLQIFADIIDILSTHTPFKDQAASTRFPEVEERLLQACCKDFEEYNDVIKLLFTRSASSNVEEEYGKAVEDVIREKLAESKIHPDKNSVFVRSSLIQEWTADVLPTRGNASVQMVRSLASQGHCPMIHPKMTLWPPSGPNRRRGVLWLNENKDDPTIAVEKKGRGIQIIDKDNNKISEEMFLL